MNIESWKNNNINVTCIRPQFFWHQWNAFKHNIIFYIMVFIIITDTAWLCTRYTARCKVTPNAQPTQLILVSLSVLSIRMALNWKQKLPGPSCRQVTEGLEIETWHFRLSSHITINTIVSQDSKQCCKYCIILKGHSFVILSLEHFFLSFWIWKRF